MDKKYMVKEIISMVKKIESTKIITLIYGFTRAGYREERAGRGSEV